jgi:hypothetical protein
VKQLVIFLLPVLLLSCGNIQIKQPKQSIKNSEKLRNISDVAPQECYGKCLIQDKTKIDTLVVFEYTGTDISNEFVKERTITQPVRYVWKKLNKKKVNSFNEFVDNEVWCLVEKKVSDINFFELIDTSQLKEVQLKYIFEETVISYGGYTENRKVVCQEEITDELLLEISVILNEAGFYDQFDGKSIDQETIFVALENYQLVNGLPITYINMETLDFMNIIY